MSHISQVSHLVIKMSARPVVIQFKLAHSHGWHVGAGCWQKASVPSYVDLFIGLLEFPHDMAADFPRMNDPRMKKKKLQCFLGPSLRNHTLPYPIVFTGQPIQGGRDIYKGEHHWDDLRYWLSHVF